MTTSADVRLHDREHARQQIRRMAEVGVDDADDRRAAPRRSLR